MVERSTLDERSVAQLGDRLLKFGLRVHHDRPVPRDRFLDRPPRDEQKANALLARLHLHLVDREGGARLGVEDAGLALPRDRLLDRLAGDQQESDAVLASLDGDLVAAVEQHQGTVARPLSHQRLIILTRFFGQDTKRL